MTKRIFAPKEQDAHPFTGMPRPQLREHIEMATGTRGPGSGLVR